LRMPVNRLGLARLVLKCETGGCALNVDCVPLSLLRWTSTLT
jgi:hypothetical protein